MEVAADSVIVIIILADDDGQGSPRVLPYLCPCVLHLQRDSGEHWVLAAWLLLLFQWPSLPDDSIQSSQQ